MYIPGERLGGWEQEWGHVSKGALLEPRGEGGAFRGLDLGTFHSRLLLRLGSAMQYSCHPAPPSRLLVGTDYLLCLAQGGHVCPKR